MKLDGKPLTTLLAGDYTFVVSDRSARQNFHLKGPGLDKKTGATAGGAAQLHDEAGEGRLQLLERRQPEAEGDVPGHVSQPEPPGAHRTAHPEASHLPGQRSTMRVMADPRADEDRLRPVAVAGARARDPLRVQARDAGARDQRARPGAWADALDLAPLRGDAGAARLPPAEPAVAEVPARPARPRPRLLGDQLDGAPPDRRRTCSSSRDETGHTVNMAILDGTRHRLHRALPQPAAGPARDRPQPARRLAAAGVLHVDGQGAPRRAGRRARQAVARRGAVPAARPEHATTGGARAGRSTSSPRPGSRSTTRSSPTACARSPCRCGTAAAGSRGDQPRRAPLARLDGRSRHPASARR